MKSMLKEGNSVDSDNYSGVVNINSGGVNSNSGNDRKVFTIERNECSRFSGLGVHALPDWVFTVGRNMQQAETALLPKMVEYMVLIASEHIVGNRPGRSEPRAVKKRPKPYKRLQHSRPQARRLKTYQRKAA